MTTPSETRVSTEDDRELSPVTVEEGALPRFPTFHLIASNELGSYFSGRMEVMSLRDEGDDMERTFFYDIVSAYPR